MGSALVYVVVVALVAGVVYLAVALVFGRGEELAPMPPGSTPTRLPARDVRGEDVRGLRFQQTLRGYKCGEVDWALERLAAEVDDLRTRLASLERAGPPDAPTNPTGRGGREPGAVGRADGGADPPGPADSAQRQDRERRGSTDWHAARSR